jgi:hypothetical protein
MLNTIKTLIASNFNRRVGILQNSLAYLFQVPDIMTGQGMNSPCRALTVPQSKQGYTNTKSQLSSEWNVRGSDWIAPQYIIRAPDISHLCLEITTSFYILTDIYNLFKASQHYGKGQQSPQGLHRRYTGW